MGRRVNGSSSDALLREIHTAIVGTPDGSVRGIRARVEDIESRHKAKDDGRKLRIVLETVKHSSSVIAGAIAGYLGGHK